MFGKKLKNIYFFLSLNISSLNRDIDSNKDPNN